MQTEKQSTSRALETWQVESYNRANGSAIVTMAYFTSVSITGSVTVESIMQNNLNRLIQ